MCGLPFSFSPLFHPLRRIPLLLRVDAVGNACAAAPKATRHSGRRTFIPKVGANVIEVRGLAALS